MDLSSAIAIEHVEAFALPHHNWEEESFLRCYPTKRMYAFWKHIGICVINIIGTFTNDASAFMLRRYPCRNN